MESASFVVTSVHTICLYFYLLFNVSLQQFEHSLIAVYHVTLDSKSFLAVFSIA